MPLLSRSDNINVHELGDMLRYLGFSVGAISGNDLANALIFGGVHHYTTRYALLDDAFSIFVAGTDNLYMLLAQVRIRSVGFKDRTSSYFAGCIHHWVHTYIQAHKSTHL